MRPLYIGLASVWLVCSAGVARSQSIDEDSGKPPGILFTLSGSAIAQLDADLDGQGSYSVSTLLFRASGLKPLSRRTLAGLSVSYELHDYDFSDNVQLESASPWDRVHGANLAAPIIRQINARWSVLLSPSIGWFGASGASSSDALTYGMTGAATYAFRQDRKLGFGVAAFDRIGESRAFPFLSIEWQLSERWRLGNPLTVGPTGPAGLEVAYQISPQWEFGAGGAYRNIRFRLDEQDLEPNGIGEQRGIATFTRLLYQFSPAISLGLYTGLVVDGELRIEDENADRRRTVEHDPAPLLAFSLSARF